MHTEVSARVATISLLGIINGQRNWVLFPFFFKMGMRVPILLACCEEVTCTRPLEQCLCTVSAHASFEFSQQLTFVHIFKLKQQNYSLRRWFRVQWGTNTKTSKAHLKSEAWVGSNFYHHTHRTRAWAGHRLEEESEWPGFVWNGFLPFSSHSLNSLNSPVRQVRDCTGSTLRMGRSKSMLPPSLPKSPSLLTRGERTSGTGFEALQLQSH